MSRYIIKLERDNRAWYLEWSTIVDAPVTYGMSLEEFKAWYRDEYGRRDYEQDFADRMKRVEARGISSSTIGYTLDDLMMFNRAGDKEEHLTKDQIVDKYCVGRPNDF